MKYALVTGGSRGIGRAICVKLAEQGYNILINFKSNEEEAKKTVDLVQQKNVTEDRVEDGVRNLIGHLVGVTFGDGFAGEEEVVRHCGAPSFEVALTRVVAGQCLLGPRRTL